MKKAHTQRTFSFECPLDGLRRDKIKSDYFFFFTGFGAVFLTTAFLIGFGADSFFAVGTF